MSKKTSGRGTSRGREDHTSKKMAPREGMTSDGQLYLCCAQCGEYVNSSEADAHKCPEPVEASEAGIRAALRIVLDLARAAIPEPSVHLPASKEEISRAMDVVEDLASSAGTAVSIAHEERLSTLFDAMERHGNVEGTETQLGDAEEFLRLAFETMSAVQRIQFLESDLVMRFIEREQGADNDEKPVSGRRNPCN